MASSGNAAQPAMLLSLCSLIVRQVPSVSACLSPFAFRSSPVHNLTSLSLSHFSMRTRSRQGGGEGKPAAEEAQAASTPRSSSRSAKKRSAPETSSPSAETKKPKGLASAAPAATPPSKAARAKGASLQKAKKSAPSKPSKEGKAVEDQSLANDKDGEAGAINAGLGVAPKGRCVSGRDWKARNQSQRCGYAARRC